MFNEEQLSETISGFSGLHDSVNIYGIVCIKKSTGKLGNKRQGLVPVMILALLNAGHPCLHFERVNLVSFFFFPTNGQ